jgi:transcriptional regulator of acetoin/glycerol metabolism
LHQQRRQKNRDHDQPFTLMVYDVQEASWDRFQETGLLDAVRTTIGESWERAERCQIDPEPPTNNMVDIEPDSALVRAASPALQASIPIITGQTSSVGLGDSRGALVWQVHTDGLLSSKLEAAGIEPSRCFDESLVGTNGLGLALHTTKPCIVVGPEHYKQAWHQWTCAAAPIHHVITGEVIGVVNIACRVADTSEALRIALMTAVMQVRLALWEASSGPERRLLDAYQRLKHRTTRPTLALNEDILLVSDEASHVADTRAELWASLVGCDRVKSIRLSDGQLASVFRVSDNSRDGYVLVLDDAPTVRSDRQMQVGALTALEQAERDVIESTLRRCAWNRSKAASELGISRGTLYSRIRRYRIPN